MTKNFLDGKLSIVPRSKIEQGERKRQEYGNIESLVLSIKEEGLINPITVMEKSGTDEYLLIAGGRRLTALDILEWTEIPVRIFPQSTDPLVFRLLELKENLERKDLTWSEEILSLDEIHRLQIEKFGEKQHSYDEKGHSMRDTAKMLGRSISSVSMDIELAQRLKEVPNLADLDNKHQAAKLIKQVGKNLTNRTLAKKLEEEKKNSSTFHLQKKLLDNYTIEDFFKSDLPANFFDLVDLDPPYGINFESPGSLRSKHLRTDFVEVPKEEYSVFLLRALKKCYTVMREDAWILIWYAPEPWAEVTYQAILEAGFGCSRYNGIWEKEGTKPFCPDLRRRLSQSYESFYYARKGDPGFVREGSKAIFSHPPVLPSKKTHPTEKPISLMKELLKVFVPEGSRILVPFAGSGNTMLAATNLNMSSFGFELSEQYKENFKLKVMRENYGEYTDGR